jgi:hypothetical protein
MSTSVELFYCAWKVCLCELAYPGPESGTELQHILYCDLIGLQLVSNTLSLSPHHSLAVSRRTLHIDKVYYVPVEKMGFQTVAVELLTKLGDRVPFPDIVKPLFAVLHFSRRSNRV